MRAVRLFCQLGWPHENFVSGGTEGSVRHSSAQPLLPRGGEASILQSAPSFGFSFNRIPSGACTTRSTAALQAVRGRPTLVPGGAGCLVLDAGSSPTGPFDGHAELLKARPESRFSGHRVNSGARSAKATAAHDVRRPRGAFVSNWADDLVRLIGARPDVPRRYGADLGEVKPVPSLSVLRAVAGAYATRVLSCSQVVRPRVALVPVRADHLVARARVDPPLVGGRGAHLFKAFPEGGFGGTRVLPGTSPTDPAAP